MWGRGPAQRKQIKKKKKKNIKAREKSMLHAITKLSFEKN